MGRPRQRVRLEDGLKLDVNKLLRDACWPRERETRLVGSEWTSSWHGLLARALITIQRDEENRGSLKILLAGKFEQRLDLIAEPRHFGGQQWYAICPVRGKKCSVVWLPPGATRFCSRQAWGKQVAYSTQFESKFDRAITARGKIKDKLIGDLDRRAWDLPPKPKWMRWQTYDRLANKYLLQEKKMDHIMANYLAGSAS